MKIWATLCLMSLSLSAIAEYNPEFEATVSEFITEGIRPEKEDMVGFRKTVCHYSIYNNIHFDGALYGKIEDQQLLATFILDPLPYDKMVERQLEKEVKGTWKINRGLAIYYFNTTIGATQRYEVRKNNGDLLIRVNDSMYCRAKI